MNVWHWVDLEVSRELNLKVPVQNAVFLCILQVLKFWMRCLCGLTSKLMDLDWRTHHMCQACLCEATRLCSSARQIAATRAAQSPAVFSYLADQEHWAFWNHKMTKNMFPLIIYKSAIFFRKITLWTFVSWCCEGCSRLRVLMRHGATQLLLKNLQTTGLCAGQLVSTCNYAAPKRQLK